MLLTLKPRTLGPLQHDRDGDNREQGIFRRRL